MRITPPPHIVHAPLTSLHSLYCNDRWRPSAATNAATRCASAAGSAAGPWMRQQHGSPPASRACTGRRQVQWLPVGDAASAQSARLPQSGQRRVMACAPGKAADSVARGKAAPPPLLVMKAAAAAAAASTAAAVASVRAPAAAASSSHSSLHSRSCSILSSQGDCKTGWKSGAGCGTAPSRRGPAAVLPQVAAPTSATKARGRPRRLSVGCQLTRARGGTSPSATGQERGCQDLSACPKSSSLLLVSQVRAVGEHIALGGGGADRGGRAGFWGAEFWGWCPKQGAHGVLWVLEGRGASR